MLCYVLCCGVMRCCVMCVCGSLCVILCVRVRACARACEMGMRSHERAPSPSPAQLMDKLYALYNDVNAKLDEWRSVLWVDVVGRTVEMGEVGVGQRVVVWCGVVWYGVVWCDVDVV